MSLTAYISQRVVLPEGVRPAAILVDDDSGRIVRIAEADAPPAAERLCNIGEHAILPGLIDPHVHINEPGRTEWEGFATATRAAAAGGITTVIDMPLNCLPPTTTVAGLEAKRHAAACGAVTAKAQCRIDWRAWGGCENGNQAHLIPLAEAGVPGYKCFLVYPGCDGLGLIDEANLRRAMPLIAQTGLPLLVHAELPGPLEAVAAALALAVPACDWRDYSVYLASRPDEAELAAIALMIDLCREFGARVHIVHLATALALPMLRDARAEGLPITVETCPHYLHFAAEDIPGAATHFKCAPPIRSEPNRQQLWDAVLDGTIDLIASDHSPCPQAMKTGNPTGSFQTSWGGIASLSLGPSILWTEGRLTLSDLARLMSSAPAKLAGVAHSKGSIAPGFDADLAIFAPEESFTVAPENLHFRHAISPYLGETLTGVVKQTILRGHTIYDHGRFPGEPIGREVRP